MWLLDWHFYHSSLNIGGRIMFWILKNLSLILRDILVRTPEVISNQNLFSRFQSWCWTIIQKMNSKDKATLEKFCVKESSNLICLGNFWAAGVSSTAVLGWYFPNQSKSDRMSTHRSPPHTKFLHSPHESLTLPIITWSGRLKSKN